MVTRVVLQLRAGGQVPQEESNEEGGIIASIAASGIDVNCAQCIIAGCEVATSVMQGSCCQRRGILMEQC